MLTQLVRRVCLLLLVIVLGGCSAQFGYRFADTYVEWQLAKYVDLSGSLEDNVDRSIDELHQWHAQTQLPRYRDLLVELIEGIDTDTLTVKQVVGLSEQAYGFWTTIRNQLEPYALTYLPQLTPEQRQQLLENLRERLQEEREDYQERDPEDAKKERLDKLFDRAKEWLGPLQKEQRTLLRRWLEQRGSSREQWLAYQQRWLELFAATLNNPEAADYAEQMSLLITQPEQLRSDELNRMVAANTLLTQQLSVDIYSTLTNGQKQHLRNKLEGYRKTLDSLIENFATSPQ
ncbi:hypothetical protein PSI9734_00556 [Pseudidiomarina piscicola]|uniref:Lipoprotein n=1 Tax=Pseudidiomarina piscicola TaxID=2614830 RepID=A0A6S6WQI9_9GAMM|nr:DUF6279 family lipoprotein [Pseudidiomarina piscicola]CAB0149984.1 hypothetical protein PSI9734_00556 [Pseudidiomarina piscicola]VZT39430.1 hypothetical protein PSI9734_00556 [Pseudomonas aeruginosa]